MFNITAPRTLYEVMELVSKLRSRKAVYATAISYLRSCYKDTDAGKAEMRITREDLGAVPQLHIEEALIEMENRIELIDAELEQLQNQPVGGGAPPAADQPSAEAENDAITTAVKAQVASKKGTPSGKSRAQGGGPS